MWFVFDGSYRCFCGVFDIGFICSSIELQLAYLIAGDLIMAANAFVRARVDEVLKNEAASVLAEMGLTVSDLVRITLTKVAREKALPFDIRIPNKLTAKTIADSEKGLDVHKVKDADDLFNQLGI